MPRAVPAAVLIYSSRLSRPLQQISGQFLQAIALPGRDQLSNNLPAGVEILHLPRPPDVIYLLYAEFPEIARK